MAPVSDIFSIGAVYHILLVKRCLFPGKEARNVYENNKNLNFDLNQTIYDSINPLAMDLLKRMLVVSPGERLKASECLQHEFLQVESMEEEKIGASPAYTS